MLVQQQLPSHQTAHRSNFCAALHTGINFEQGCYMLKVTMGFVVLCGAAIMGLHAYIVKTFPQQRVPTEMVAKAQRLAQRRRRRQAEQQRESLAASVVAPSSAGATAVSRRM